MRIFIAGWLVGFLLLSYPHISEAHVGGGPPFVSVDGTNAQTNPQYLSGPVFVLPWDLDNQLHLVNSAIHFKINLHNLPVPYEIAQQTSFRWTWDENGNDTTTGDDVSHTYSKIGSHLVSLDVLPPGETDWLNYDTIRINITPSAGYVLPKISLSVVKSTFISNSPIHFISNVITDSTAKVNSTTWDFGDSFTSKEANPSHSYTESDFLYFAYIQVRDSKGFTQESGATLAGNKGKITLSPLIATGPAIPFISAPSSTQTQNHSSVLWIVIALLLLLIVAGGAGWMVTKHPVKKDPT